MQQLTPAGQRLVADLAQRHRFSPDAVTHMLFAVLHGNGSMAQFDHPEFAGSGQWMQGGMLMLGNMFDHGLKARVDALCNELSNILASQPGLLHSGSFQSQSQSGGGQQQNSGFGPGNYGSESSLFVPDPAQHWWPPELGQPSATGSQNNVQYAYFAGLRRLAVKTGGQVWVYDTLDHQIGGFSQQQGAGGSILFTSQYGTVVLSSLPVVSIDGQPQYQPPPRAAGPADTASAPSPGGPRSGDDDIFGAIERLGKLRADGLLTEEEFAQKKAELLGRL
jgi:hypothetical protein